LGGGKVPEIPAQQELLKKISLLANKMKKPLRKKFAV
jgi:hypothetical protein